jgi:hypothetical protein
MSLKADASLLRGRVFVESFDVSSFIFLVFCHLVHLCSIPSVGKSGAALVKENALAGESLKFLLET